MTKSTIDRSEPIPGYRLLERIGSGGFGEVWRCEAPGGMHKAIKFVYGDIDATGDGGLFAEREQKALERVKQIRHPFILSLERFDIVDGRLVIVTELADCNLWDCFRRYRSQGMPGIPRLELLDYLEEAAEALDMMNGEHQLQHLDIKPQNLFLVCKHVKVADFGLVKVFEGTRTKITGGVTPVYAAPETCEGWISRYCDQYSLAIVYQELLTGVRPFNGSNTKQLLMQHLSAPPNLEPLPEGDRPAVGRALAKLPDDRFPTCMDFIDALRLSGKKVTSDESRVTSIDQTPLATHHPPLATSDRKAPRPVLAPRPRPSPAIPIAKSGECRVASGANALPRHTALATRHSSPATDSRHVEQVGPGILQPTVVVGVGGIGGQVVHRLAAAVADRLGSPSQIPAIQFLVFDTDPDSLKKLIADGELFEQRSIVPLRLQRPSHYTRREKELDLDSWLDSALLYRMPRLPASNGIRAYGRLALLDHARVIGQRVNAALLAATAPNALADSDRLTGLALRTNRPRVLVVAALSGGAGSGMLVDLAYLMRAALERAGFIRSEVNGMLFVPAATDKPHALANAHAALTEIAHFSRGDTTYQLREQSGAPPFIATEPPFTRITALPLAAAGDAARPRSIVGQAAGLLYTELFDPLGRAVDEARGCLSSLGTSVPNCRVAVTYRLTWPRRRLIRRAALRLSERLLRLWTHKDSAAVRPTVLPWIEEQWTLRGLQPELLIERVHDACRATIGQPPDAKFDSLVQPLVERTALGSKLDAYSTCAVLDDLFELIGKPLAKGELEPVPGLLQRIVSDTMNDLAAEYEKKLAEMAVHFIEQPGARLAAAEEAIRQLIERLHQLVATYERLVVSMENEVSDLYRRLFPMIGALDTGALGARKSTIAQEVLELLRGYPKKRYQAMVAGLVLSTYRGMLGTAPEYLREVNFCRERLAEVAALAEHAIRSESVSNAGLGPGRELFTHGHASLNEAAAGVVAQVSTADLVTFDERVQQQVRRHFKSVVNYCLETAHNAKSMLDAIESQAQTFVEEHIGENGAADVFFEHCAHDEQTAHRAMAEAVAEAVPDLPLRRSSAELLSAVAVSDGPDGDRIFQIAEQAVADGCLIRTSSRDDVVLYREMRCVPLSDLPPFAPAGREAYESLLHSETPPHARRDIAWWRPGR